MSAITPGKPRSMNMADRRPQGSRNQHVTPNIDPIRIIRRHVLTIIGSVIIGLALGTVAHFGFSRFYPLYTGEVIFELQPGIQDPTQVGTTEITREDLLERLARTQTVLLVSREVLVRAMEDPDITRATTWHEWFVDDDGIFDITRFREVSSHYGILLYLSFFTSFLISSGRSKRSFGKSTLCLILSIVMTLFCPRIVMTVL